jgi:hypothetical protein
MLGEIFDVEGRNLLRFALLFYDFSIFVKLGFPFSRCSLPPRLFSESFEANGGISGCQYYSHAKPNLIDKHKFTSHDFVMSLDVNARAPQSAEQSVRCREPGRGRSASGKTNMTVPVEEANG